MFYKNILSHPRPLLRSLNALHVYQINLYQRLNFMYKLKNKQTTKIFNDIIKKPVHHYPTRSSKDNFSIKKFLLRSTKCWNEFLTHGERLLEFDRLFLKKIKSSLLDTENQRKYF